MRLALDIPGGDHHRAPEERVSAALRALEIMPDLEIIMTGTREQLDQWNAQFDLAGQKRISLHEADIVISMDLAGDPLKKFVARQRVLHKRHADQGRMSVFEAAKLVKTGAADAALSAGNTGGINFAAKKEIGMLEHVKAPTIVTFFPTRDRSKLVGLGDSGLVIDRPAASIAEAALLTGATVKALLGVEKPVVGLLNIGTEQGKGRKEVAAANIILGDIAPKLNHVSYAGNKEPSDIFHGRVDAMGADGFDGNLALKMAEAAGLFVGDVTRKNLRRGWVVGPSITWVINWYKFRRIRKHLSLQENAAGLLIGPNGLFFKVHADADEKKYLAGILQAARVTKKDPMKSLRATVPGMVEPLEGLYTSDDDEEKMT
jgi:phosphate acyltransferase